MCRQLSTYVDLERSLEWLENREIPADKATFIALLARCIRDDALCMGRRVHAQISRAGRDGEAFIGNHLVEMYGKCGCIARACATFDCITQRNARSWNIMLAAYANDGHLAEAQALFDQMPEKNVVSWNTILSTCRDGHNVIGAKSLFDQMPVKDTVSWNTLMTALAVSGHLDAASNLLFQMPHRDASSWNAMISGYVRAGQGREALQLFSTMDLEGQQPNLITLAEAISACTDLAITSIVHSSLEATGLDTNIIVAVSLIAAYGRHGSVDSARRCFDGISRKDVVSWTAILTAYAQNGLVGESVRLFRLMSLDGTRPCKVTLLTIFHACATDASKASSGRAIHESLAGTGLDLDVFVGTALVDMYGNAGKLDEAWSAFVKLPKKNVAAWTAIITANAQSGHGSAALELFREMLVAGVELNEITVLSALAACSRGGLVEDGRSLFSGVESDFHFARNLEHYQCAVDLLGRVGQVELAEELVSSMPFQPGSAACTTLAAACRTHGSVEQGVRAANAAAAAADGQPCMVSGLAPRAAVSAAVLVSNTYATSL